MGIKITMEISSPLTEEDDLLLGGLAMLALSVAGTRGAVTQEEQPDDDEAPLGPAPCGSLEFVEVENDDGPQATGRMCLAPVGHKGRHRYREEPGRGLN